jgi:hypothetical protein
MAMRVVVSDSEGCGYCDAVGQSSFFGIALE